MSIRVSPGPITNVFSHPDRAASAEPSAGADVTSLAQLVDADRLVADRSALPSVDSTAQAITDGSTSLSWAEFVEDVARLASSLSHAGVRRGDRVAVHLTKSVRSFVAVHAVLRAGGVMVPLDPLAPVGHLAAVIADAAPTAIITDARPAALAALFAERAVGDRVAVVVRPAAHEPLLGESVLEVLADTVESAPVEARVTTGPDDPAYIIYTSGSTGRPKGIVHTHASALAYAAGAMATYELTPADRLANIAPLHFDQSTFELYAGPLAGACTIVVPDPILRFPASLSSFVAEHRATVWYSVPYLIGQLSTRGALDERDLSSLRWVLFGGESFPPAQLATVMRQLPAARFSNVYGPAEVNHCTHLHVRRPPTDDAPISIGRAWPWAELRIVDADSLQPAPAQLDPTHPVDPAGDVVLDAREVGVGEPGELLVQSPTMMQGYWNRPDLTGRSIVRLAGTKGRWYRTGDLVALRPDGDLDFLGRVDNQIKLRGHRIELEAVDAALRDLHGVSAATVVVDRPPDAEHRLVALVVADDQSDETSTDRPERSSVGLDPRDVLADLARRLPRYAVPADVMLVPALPRTATGKVDRNAAHDLLSQQPDS